MLYIFCAFYAEAAELIDKYSLKKQDRCGSLRFDIFENEAGGIRLVLTGPGMINAAAAVSAVFTFYGIGAADRLVNIGICAGRDPAGSVVIADKLVNRAAGRTFYPDMLLKTDLPERTLVTEARPVTAAQLSEEETQRYTDVGTLMPGMDAEGGADMPGPEKGSGAAAPGRYPAGEEKVYDMEGAAIYETVVMFTGPDRISFIKVVSDNGTGGSEYASAAGCERPGDLVEQIMKAAFPAISAYIEIQKAASLKGRRGQSAVTGTEGREDATWQTGSGLAPVTGSEVIEPNPGQTGSGRPADDGEQYIKKTAEDMRCSQTMQKRLEQLLRYAELAGLDHRALIRGFYEAGRLPAANKNAGKQVLDELADKLIQS